MMCLGVEPAPRDDGAADADGLVARKGEGRVGVARCGEDLAAGVEPGLGVGASKKNSARKNK